MIRQSLGGQLLLDAFTVVSVAIAVAAGRLFVVNAIYERTVNIYWHIGFTPLRKSDSAHTLTMSLLPWSQVRTKLGSRVNK